MYIKFKVAIFKTYMIIKKINQILVVIKKQFKNDKKREYTSIESYILGIIIELLKAKATDIILDQAEGRYFLSNEGYNFKIVILSYDYIIKLISKEDSIMDKYDRIFIEDVLKIVQEEENRRIRLIQTSIESNIEVMTGRFYGCLVKLNEENNVTSFYDN